MCDIISSGSELFGTPRSLTLMSVNFDEGVTSSSPFHFQVEYNRLRITLEQLVWGVFWLTRAASRPSSTYSGPLRGPSSRYSASPRKLAARAFRDTPVFNFDEF